MSRTGRMFTHMETNTWNFSEAKRYVTIPDISGQNKKFRVVSRALHDNKVEPLVSIGASNSDNREILLLDPASPDIQTLYEQLKTQIDKTATASLEENLKRIMVFVRSLFTKDKEEEIQRVARSFSQLEYQGQPVTYIDDFIVTQTGYCRHYNLLLYYFLCALKQENLLPKVTIYHHRDDIMINGKHEAHIWIMLQFENPNQLYHLDSKWYDTPHLMQDDLANNPILLKYGVQAAKNCKTRYPAIPLTLPTPVEYKITKETFTLTDNNGSLTCEITSEGKKFTYTSAASLGKGSYGEVYAMTSTDSSAPPVVVKSFFLQQTYPVTTSPQEIASIIKNYFERAKHEAEYNEFLGGIGIYYSTGEAAPIQTQLITLPDGTSHQQLLNPPRAYIAIKKEQGCKLSQYNILTAIQYLNFCTSATRSLANIHAQGIVHSDIHEGNLIVHENKSQPSTVVVNYVDMTFCGREGIPLSTLDFILDIKPPEFKTEAFIRRHPTQDIYCLGRVFKEKYNVDHFPNNLQSQVKKIFESMMSSTPSQRPDLDHVLIELNEVKQKYFISQFFKHPYSFIQQLKKISDPVTRLDTLKELIITVPESIVKLSNLLEVKELVSLWTEYQQKNEVLQLLCKLKLNLTHSSNIPQTDTVINERFYCMQILKRLENANPATLSQEIISYQNIQSSIPLEAGRGAKRYLEHAVKTADNFVPCLTQLTPAEQLYLLTHGESQKLRNLVNESNFLNLLKIIQHQDLLLKKLNNDAIKYVDISKLTVEEQSDLLTYANPQFLHQLMLHVGDEKFISLWKNEKLQINILQCLFRYQSALLKISPQSDVAINERLFCESVLSRLNKTTTPELIKSYRQIYTSTVAVGAGLTDYRAFCIKKADNFVSCLTELTPAEQLYLLTYVEVKDLVKKNNFLNVLKVIQHPDLLLKKLGNNHLKYLDIFKLGFELKLSSIKTSPKPFSEQAINELLYCEQVLYRLNNNTISIEDLIASYREIHTSTLQEGRGAALYLEFFVNTPEQFEDCLAKLSVEEQSYLSTHANPQLHQLMLNVGVEKSISFATHEPLQKSVFQYLFKKQLDLINSSAQPDSESAINQRFYCQHAIYTLEKENKTTPPSTDELKDCYLKIQSPNFKIEKSAESYLASHIKAPDEFVSHLNTLKPAEQLYLLNHGGISLNNLIDEKNALEILNKTQDPKLFLKKLDPIKREIVIHCMVSERINSSSFKKAIKSFDTWNQEGNLYKDILLAFNQSYFIKRNADKRFYHSIFGYYNKSDKLQASRALNEAMDQQTWKKFGGALTQGDLGQIGRRFKKTVCQRK